MVSVVDPALIAAYEATHYVVVDASVELILRIGRLDAALDDLLDRHAARTAALVTAFNPESVVLPIADNKRRHDELLVALKQRGIAALPAEGRDPKGSWLAETSYLVLSITLTEAQALGRQFAQNAIVFIERQSAPRLVLLR